VVLALTTYARLLKSFGQNNTIWVCVPGLLADNGLSRTRLGTIFSFACIAAAGVQPRLGRFYDEYGGRICISYSLLALSASLLALAAARSDSQVFLALVGLRTIGLGALDTYTSNTVSVWFVRRRGVALACMTVGWALVRSLHSCRHFRIFDSPAGALGQGGFWFCVGLLSRVSRTSLGWRGALRVAAALCAASAPLTALLLRRSPERVGLLPDCDDAPAEPKAGEPAAAAPPAEAPSSTRAEALATPLFAVWAVYTLLFFFAASGSDFHLIGILAESGQVQPAHTLSLSNGASAAFSVLAFGAGLDKVWLRADHLLTAAGILLALYLLMLTRCDSDAAAYAAGLVKGAGDAAAAVASPYLHAKFFGREHLGSIFAANRMAGVVGSGLGPLLIGAWADRSDGDYRAALRAISLAVLAATAAAQTVFWREEERRQRELVKPAGDVELVSLTSADGGGSSVGLGSS